MIASLSLLSVSNVGKDLSEEATVVPMLDLATLTKIAIFNGTKYSVPNWHLRVIHEN